MSEGTRRWLRYRKNPELYKKIYKMERMRQFKEGLKIVGSLYALTGLVYLIMTHVDLAWETAIMITAIPLGFAVALTPLLLETPQEYDLECVYADLPWLGLIEAEERERAERLKRETGVGADKRVYK